MLEESRVCSNLYIVLEFDDCNPWEFWFFSEGADWVSTPVENQSDGLGFEFFES